MRILAACVAACFLLGHAEAVLTGRGKPGYCANNDECNKRAAGYECVAVQTTRQNIEAVQQCLPSKNESMPLCSGAQPGLCPSFSTTWGNAFREIASVCAYIVPNLNNKCIQPGHTRKSQSEIKCLFIDDPKNATSKLGVIFGCVDFDGRRLLFKTDDRSDRLQRYFNYSTTVKNGCVNPQNPSGSNFVCSSQGTCAPKNANSMDELECRCNVGFSGKYCEKIVDNMCYNDGVCGGGTCDLTTMECTKCKIGTTGNKCAECVPNAQDVCSGHGKCVPASGDSTLGADAAKGTPSNSNSTSTSTSTSSTAGSSTGSSANEPSVGDLATIQPNGTSHRNTSTTHATHAGKVVPLAYRKLESTSYQCKCFEGYSDVHCAIHVGTRASHSNSTPSAVQDSSAQGVTLSIAVVGATIVSALAV